MNTANLNKERRMRFMLMENHDSAYHAWKALSLQGMTAVHIDAHLDILTDSTNNIHFGNYLFQAIKDKIVTKLYWVVPGTRKEFMEDLIYVKKIISSLAAHDHITLSSPPPQPHLINGVITTTLFGIPAHICTVEDVPKIGEDVLLDIDVDFFIIKRIRDNSNIQQVGERKPWIGVPPFVKKIQKKIHSPFFTTIAYSVNEGYTPLVYKTLGDRLAAQLGFVDEGMKTRLLAATHFARFRKYLDQDNIVEARKNLNAALYLNPLYAIPENTYGGLLLKKKDLEGAHDEFSRMLKVDKSNIHALIGMGIVELYRNKLQRAEMHFKKALVIDPGNERSLLYRSWIEYKLKRYKQAEDFCKTGISLNRHNFYFIYLAGKLAQRKGKNKQANDFFKRAVQTGALSDIPMGLELLMD